MSEKVMVIEWLDSETSSEGWVKRDEISDVLELTYTVGFIAHEFENAIVIAHSRDPATDSWNGLITIPRSAIERMRVLGRVKV